MTTCNAIDKYIRIVRSGSLPVCKDQLALADYVERCFQTDDIHVDENQLDRYLGLQKYFSFSLLPWEEFVFALHNCTYNADGSLRWPVLVIYVGRGAGKNGFLAFESFAWITPINGIPNYDVDVFATSEDQAKTSPDDVREVLENHRRELEKRFDWNKECITNKKTKSRIRFRTSNHKSKDGGRPGAVVFDEYHAYENYKMVDVATTGLGKKEHPRQTIITTDGYIRGGPLDDLKKQAKNILYHNQDDGGMLPFFCSLDNQEEIDLPDMWTKANPSLAYFPTLRKELEREYVLYKQNPSSAASFVVKRMNLPAEREEADVTKWDNILAANRAIPDLTGCDCVAGIDYAKTTDFVAAGLLFKKEGIYYWITKTWVCRQSADLQRIRAPLDKWEANGLLEFVDGPEIPPEVPADWLWQQGQKYNITRLGLDSFRRTLLAKALRDVGFDDKRDGANNILLTKPVTIMRWAPVIESVFSNQCVVWGDNPLMNWYTQNTCVSIDKSGNMLYQKKEAKSRKTDGFMALVAAICSSEDLADCGDNALDLDMFRVMTY